MVTVFGRQEKDMACLAEIVISELKLQPACSRNVDDPLEDHPSSVSVTRMNFGIKMVVHFLVGNLRTLCKGHSGQGENGEKPPK